ncbi:MAG: metallophosphoesterase family protein [Cardiobacteriaceae bacterium]|nr:metallophosphoesterase family protein [Cardiobacteriaceae bacterium]
MRIAIHSDLHTEIRPHRLEALEWAELLILAGDCGNLDTLPAFYAGLREDAPRLPVLAILGNHDRYGMTREEGVAAHRALAEAYSIRLLDDEAVIFADILICGTTLWTDFTLAGDPAASMQWAQATLPDFREIRDDNGQALTAATMRHWHEESCAFLQQALATDTVREKIVVSHFLPSRTLVAPEHGEDHEALVKSAYWASELPDLYRAANYWIYGHSHTNINARSGNTTFISNQRGARRQAAGYDPGYLLVV